MRHILKVAIASSLTCLLNIYSFGQEGQLAGKIVKLILKDGKETLQVFEKTASRDQHLLYNLEDRELLEQIKKAHPGQNFSDIKLTSEEFSKVMRKQWEKDNPAQAAEQRRMVELRENAVLSSSLSDQMHEDEFGRIITPKNYFESPQTFISIPSSKEEYLRIFKEDKNAPLQNTLKIYNDLKSSYNLPKSANSLLASISKESNSPVIIIGHNENGNLYFPDGTTLTFKQIDDAAKKYKRIVVYLSCNAAAYTINPAVNYFLDYAQAIKLEGFLSYRLGLLKKDIKSEDAVKKINSLLNSYATAKSLKYKLKVAAYTATAGAAAYGLYQSKEHQ